MNPEPLSPTARPRNMSYVFLKGWFSGIYSRHEARENRLFDDSPGVRGEYAILTAFKWSVEQARTPFPTARSRKVSYWLFKEKVFRHGLPARNRDGLPTWFVPGPCSCLSPARVLELWTWAGRPTLHAGFYGWRVRTPGHHSSRAARLRAGLPGGH